MAGWGHRIGRVFLWRFGILPDAKEVVVNDAEGVCLSECVSMETFKEIWTGGERGDCRGVALLGPLVGPPLQEHKNPSHFFFDKRNLFLPAGLASTSFRPLNSELCIQCQQIPCRWQSPYLRRTRHVCWDSRYHQ